MYDCAIIGAGPGGLSAGLNCRRAGLKTVIFEKQYPGGQMALAHEIENYPGFEKINGAELAQKMAAQTKNSGAEFIMSEITELTRDNDIFKLAANKTFYTAKTVVLAMGGSHRSLNIPGEAKFAGHGVSYCATCDGAFFKGRVTMVVGGGDTAVGSALYLSNICKKVYLVHRRKEFRAGFESVAALKRAANIELITDCGVIAILGENKLEKVVVSDVNTLDQREIDADGIFIAAGFNPQTNFPLNGVDLLESGHIIASEDCETNIPGVFAAGDVRFKPLNQIMTAVSDGAVCASRAIKYLRRTD